MLNEICLEYVTDFPIKSSTSYFWFCANARIDVYVRVCAISDNKDQTL